MSTMTDRRRRIILGVDTHRDCHAVAVVDELGRELGVRIVPADQAGYVGALDWARSLGEVTTCGVEGTSAYGAGLARHLRAAGLEVLEVCRPDRQTRRRDGKSDPTDAFAAARAVLAGTTAGIAKTADGPIEMIRVLRVTRRSALKARTQAINQLHALIVTAPEPLRARLESLSARERSRACARLRPGVLNCPTAATKHALRSLAGRIQTLSLEITGLDHHLDALVASTAPTLCALHGVGTDVAGALLVAIGDNPDRLHTEAAFAALCGVSPVDASSGRQRRHRLNRGGDRTANNALWRITMVRLSSDPRTKTYATRRRHEGRTTREIMRCLKRYIARETYRAILTDWT